VSWVESPWILLALPVVARLFQAPNRSEDRWNTGADVGLAVACGILFAALSGLWLAKYHLRGWPLTASDFAQYCQSVASVQGGTLDHWVPQRSLPAGFLAGLYARQLGIVGGLALATLTSQAVTGAALYLWGRAAHGRVSGVASVLIGCSVAPLVVLSRTTTFYPELVAACALCSATAMLAVRYRTPIALFAGGCGSALVIAIDVRGLYWAMAGLVICLIAAVPNYLGSLPRRLVVLFAPFVASWVLAHMFLLHNQPGLDAQTLAFAADAVARVPDAQIELPAYGVNDFLWGRSMPWEIPAALWRMADISSRIPGALAGSLEVAHNREIYLLPWLGPLVGGILLWVLRMRLRVWTMLAFLLSLSPYALAMYSTATTLAHPRYLAVAMLAVPVALGVPVGAFVGSPAPPKVAVPLVGVILLLVLGVLPSWLSPVAAWRLPFNAEMEPKSFQLQVVPPKGDTQRCVTALAADRRAGRTWTPYTYPVELPALPNVTEQGELIVPGAAPEAPNPTAPVDAPSAAPAGGPDLPAGGPEGPPPGAVPDPPEAPAAAPASGAPAP